MANTNFAGILPWAFGADVTSCETTGDVLVMSGLNWDVEKIPLRAAIPVQNEAGETIDLIKRVARKFGINRKDTNEIIGVVGKNFRAVPNEEAFSIFDALTSSVGCKYTNAGSLGDGELVWMCAKVPSTLRVHDTDDVIEEHMVLTNAFNGTKTLTLRFTPVRTKTNSVLNISLRKTKDTISLRHTRNLDDRLKEASEVLGIKQDYFDSLNVVFNELATKPVGSKEFEAVLDAVMPVPSEGRPTRRENSRERIVELLAEENATAPDELKNTAWTVFNAFSSYADHHKSFKSRKDEEGSKEELRFLSILSGPSQTMKNSVLSELMAL